LWDPRRKTETIPRGIGTVVVGCLEGWLVVVAVPAMIDETDEERSGATSYSITITITTINTQGEEDKPSQSTKEQNGTEHASGGVESSH